MRIRLVAMVVAGLVLVGPAAPAPAGGSWLETVRDHHSPGDRATFVGYTGGGQLGWVEDGPFLAHLELPSGDIPVGELVLQATGAEDWTSLRVAITFTVPDLAPGMYSLEYGNAEGEGLGDIIGGTLWVDAVPTHFDPPGWPPDDPAWDGAPADVLPPGATVVTAPPSTTVPAPSPSPSSTSTTRTVAAPTTHPVRPVPAAATTSDDGGGAGPGWLLVAVGLGVVVVALTAGLRTRRHAPEPGA